MPFAAVGAVAAAGISAYASNSAGKQAASASKDAANLQAQTAAENAAREQPYVDLGDTAAGQLTAFNATGTSGQPNYLQMSQDALPGQMSQAELEQTPGYQFQLNQGLQATQNSAAARGLGVSGAALKGAASYATGLANSNYQTQFNNAQTRSQDYLNLNTGQQANNMNIYNRLAGTTTIGANAASGVATNQSASAASQGGYLSAAGQAGAAGTLGIGTAATGAANNYLTNNLLQQQIGGGGGSGGSGGYQDAGYF